MTTKIFKVSKFFISGLLLLGVIMPGVSLAQAPELSEPTAEEIAEVRALLEKDPESLTEEEVNKITPFFRPGVLDAGQMTMEQEGVAQCFDYYTFGSVQVELTPSVLSPVSGSDVTFSGTIKNNNPYPIVNGQLYVKIFARKDFAEGERVNGYPVVDQFFVLEDVTIAANGEVPVTFAWEIPAYTTTGDYELNTFFMTEKRFNLLGLPFTDDVTGNKIAFSVLGEVEDAVAFDKNSVTLNDNPYRFAAFPPTVEQGIPVMVSADIRNDTAAPVTIPVTFTLYNWAGEREENVLDSTVQQITLQPNETQTVTYEATKATGAVSFVRANLQYEDTQSILNIRFVREGIEEIRLNFPSILSYPLVGGEEAAIFSCLHSTNVPFVDNSQLVMTLRDTIGETIHTYRYEGPVSGSMMAVKDSFIPPATLTDFDLVTALYLEGELVEEVIQSYRCADIDSALCPVTEDSVSTVSPLFTYGVVLVVVLLLLSVLVMFLRQKNNQRFLSLLVLCGAALVGPLLNGTVVEAKSVTVTAGGVPELAYHWDNAPPYPNNTVPLSTTPTPTTGNNWANASSGWSWGLQPGATVQVTYQASMTNGNNGLPIADGTNIPVGTVLNIDTLPLQDTNISWVGTGRSMDSPYGNWVANAGPLPEACTVDNFVNAVSFCPTCPALGVHMLLNIDPPAPVVTTSSNLSCVGTTCTVEAAGPISAAVAFPSTYGRFYYRYYAPPGSGLTEGCRANNVPMRETVYSPWAFLGPAIQPFAYTHTIPGTAINFTANAIAAAGAPPLPPTVTPAPSNSNIVGSAQSFVLNASDPDNDTLRYGIDWNMDGTIDQWVPGSGYVASGASQSTSRTWATTGGKTFQVLAQDSNGGVSPFTSATVTIINPSVTSSLTVSGCTIGRGNSSCVGTVNNWSVVNGTSPFSVRNNTTNTLISSAPSGSGENTTLQYGYNTITLNHDNGVPLQTRFVSADCDTSVDVWNGSECEEILLPPPISAPDIFIVEPAGPPHITRQGDDVEIGWNTAGNLGCVLSTNAGVPAATDLTTVTSVTLTALRNARFTITCSTGDSDYVDLRVIPVFYES